MTEILIAWAIALPIFLIIYFAAHPKKEEGPGGVTVATDWATDEDTDGVRAYDLVRLAHRSLVRQRAALFGPWLPAIIDECGGDMLAARNERGRAVVLRDGCCPPGVALLALQWTRAELTGSRFDLSEIDEAIAFLENTGEGE